MPSEGLFATLSVNKFNRESDHYGEALLTEPVVVEESGNLVLKLSGPEGVYSPVEGFINLAKGEGKLKITTRGFKRKINLKNCDFHP